MAPDNGAGWLLTLAAVLAVGLGSSAPAAGAPRAFDVLPQETDPAIQQYKQRHRVFLDAAATPRMQLLVYLPGTGATTGEQEEFGRTAAGLGYHVIYLMYPNDVAAAVCQDDVDETSFEKFRREIITGRDLDPRVAVDRSTASSTGSCVWSAGWRRIMAPTAGNSSWRGTAWLGPRSCLPGTLKAAATRS